jgi:hypothetical protein
MDELVLLANDFLVILAKHPSTDRTFIAIDDLDECHLSSRQLLLRAIHEIASEPSIQVEFIIASRNNGEIVLRLECCPNVYIRSCDTLSDITKFVHFEADRAVRERRLLRGHVNPEIRDKVISKLVLGSGGMSVLFLALEHLVFCDSVAD